MPYEGDESFLTGPTDRTRTVWDKVSALFPEERRLGIPFPLRDTPVPEPGSTERVRDQFRERGLAAY